MLNRVLTGLLQSITGTSFMWLYIDYL